MLPPNLGEAALFRVFLRRGMSPRARMLLAVNWMVELIDGNRGRSLRLVQAEQAVKLTKSWGCRRATETAAIVSSPRPLRWASLLCVTVASFWQGMVVSVKWGMELEAPSKAPQR